MGQEETKEALKEALKEWLDEKFAELGKWSLRTLVALGLGAFTLFILNTYGWHKL